MAVRRLQDMRFDGPDTMSAAAVLSVIVCATLVITVLGCGCVRKKTKGGKQADAAAKDAKGKEAVVDAKKSVLDVKKSLDKAKKGSDKEKKGFDNVKKADTPTKKIEPVKEIKPQEKITAKMPEVKSMAPKVVQKSIRPMAKAVPAAEELNPPKWEVPAFSVMGQETDTIIDMAGQHDFKPTLYLPTPGTAEAVAAKKSVGVSRKTTHVSKKTVRIKKGEGAESLMPAMVKTAKSAPSDGEDGKATMFLSSRGPPVATKSMLKPQSIRTDAKKGQKQPVISLMV